jgi:arylsulfatase A-like enzyme
VRIGPFFAAALAFLPAPARAADRPPNFIIILCDDLGYGDLGCYGNAVIRTPHLDRMAADGARFTDFYANASVCTPTRAGLLTGRYAPRSGLTTVLTPSSSDGIDRDELTLADVLKKAGYATAIYGKWHLGHRPQHLPTRHGFDDWFGMPWPNDMDDRHPSSKGRWGPIPLYRGDKEVEKPAVLETLTRRYTEETVRFIEKNKGRPFFVYLAHTMPHRFLAASDAFRGKSKHGLYGDTVEELDWSVGEVLAALKKHGLEKDTLVFFSSDNGPAPEHPQLPDPGGKRGSPGPLRGWKGTTFEGGLRVPGIFWWPGTIRPGRVEKSPAIMLDLFPTCAALAGAKVPDGHAIDGKDLTALLTGKGPRGGDELFFYQGDTLQAVRQGRWKLKLPMAPRPNATVEKEGHPLLLIDLDADVGEKDNLADKHPEVARRLRERMAEFHKSLGPLPAPKK